VSYLLDTNVVSEIRKPRGDERVMSWYASVRGDDLFLSVLVIGEIEQDIERLRGRDPAQAAPYERWPATLRRDYADRIMLITPEIAEQWGRPLNPFLP
jgi:toxin FitB